jgi:KDO2-lipid IV(A) lauroyltransferase
MHDTAIVYMSIAQTSRGYYEISFKKILDNAHEHSRDEIMKLYVSALETQIKQQPEYWLWSHKRWKKKRN